jgi:hypothetical protein
MGAVDQHLRKNGPTISVGVPDPTPGKHLAPWNRVGQGPHHARAHDRHAQQVQPVRIGGAHPKHRTDNRVSAGRGPVGPLRRIVRHRNETFRIDSQAFGASGLPVEETEFDARGRTIEVRTVPFSLAFGRTDRRP